MKIIGLCGGSGSGKGCVSEIFSKLGIPSIDTDMVYHSLVSYRSECLTELASVFGEAIIKDDALDRCVLADIVFGENSREELRQMLNSIAHKHVLTQTKKIIAEYGNKGIPCVIVDAPLLFESGFDKMCDKIIAVVANRDLRIERIVFRDGITVKKALDRVKTQLSDEVISQKSDYIIENNGSIQHLEKQVKTIAEQLLR